MFTKIKNKIRLSFIPKIRKIILKTTIKTSIPYQPIGDILPSTEHKRPNESFSVRWKIVSLTIQKQNARNLLDIGCAEGFFIRKASLEHSVFSVGLEGNWKGMRVGMSLSELNEETGYGFVPGIITPEKILDLPKFDIVICFSVLHHIIKFGGRKAAIKFLSSCAIITKKQFLFDMGSPEETSHIWAEKLNFLSGDIVNNTKSLLQEAGFTEVKHIGNSLGHRDKVSRPIFSCSPAKK